jgi:hypothetical protein
MGMEMSDLPDDANILFQETVSRLRDTPPFEGYGQDK